ncbi:hypothetical protein ACH5RR_040683 [Cinchona calisaya]|uniref:DNA (cytosine-5-)-methyltransferase n=1 Tax=Cinchona calisaya TaxID=153742 RepID=A0ABD2XU28_9GENT
MALSMHVVDAVQPIPLKIYDPNGDKSLRRSPRYTTNKYRSTASFPALPSPAVSRRRRAPPENEVLLRRAPSLSSGGKNVSAREMGVGFLVGSKKRKVSEENNSIVLHGSENGSGSKKVNKVCSGNLRKSLRLLNKEKMSLDEKCLLKSPRLLNKEKMSLYEKCLLKSPRLLNKEKTSLDEKCLLKSPRLLNKEKMSLDEKCLLKSPRLNPNWGGLLALPEPVQKGESVKNNDNYSGKCVLSQSEQLRNRTVVMHVGKEKEKAGKSEFEDNKDCVKRREMSNVGGKSLSSRNIEFKLLEDSPKSDLANSNLCENRSRSRKLEFKLADDALAENKSEDNNNGALENSNSEENDLINTSDENKEFELPVESGLENCESDVSGVKILRSRKIVFQIDGSENVEKKDPLSRGGSMTNKEPSKKIKNFCKKESKQKSVCSFIGEPIPEEEAWERWHWRYELKSRRSKNKAWILNAGEEDETILNVEFHYARANIAGDVFNIGDCVYIKGEGRKKHIGRILEFFKTTAGEDYFRVQWFFRAEDTVMKEAAAFHDKKRLFYSTVMNDNLLDCIISKVYIVEIPPAVGLERDTIPPADFYYDMEYSVEYSTFHNLRTDFSYEIDDSHSFQPVEAFHAPITASPLEVFSGSGSTKVELALLDLYSGCGGMSTGLSIGAKISSINLVTRWAVDLEKSACDSLKLNHPESQVRNESAEDFLELLKRWQKLCECYVFNDIKNPVEGGQDNLGEGENGENSKADSEEPDEEFEVSSLVDICYGDPNETGKQGLHFKVRWKGYSPDEDTWEPIDGLSNCQERIQDFVRNGLRSKILPLPGHVDVICGGPPCQGISGYNRYRHVEDPLTDERNQQIVVFMDIVKFLKPKYVLMENVVDILRLDGASLGRYALSRLVHMKYQARLGTMAAGCYGLPQFRLRVFIWGALASERLPPFPLPTHDVVVRYWPPSEFERNTVAYDEGQPRKLEEAVFLHDAIFDLPAVTNHETREEIAYDMPPGTEFQKYIRLTREEMMGSKPIQVAEAKELLLYDHRPYCLNEDNYLRVCHIPHRKGANFRDLPGVVVGDDNVVRRDTTKDPSVLPSGEPIVPDCVFTFEKGKSKRPFARLWWDETVPTVLTFPHYKSQAILHPEQDRVLTIRECARLQGFPDFYRFCGTVKERYSQVGNAVAIPVGRALGYALGMAFQKLSGDGPLMTLPPNFSFLRPVNDEIVVLQN